MLTVDNRSLTIDNTVDNTSISLIQITEDKLENILVKHIDNIQKPNDCIGAVGLTISLACTVFATDFHGENADVIKGFFICLLTASVAYSVFVIYNRIKYRDGVEQIIKEIKGEE